MGFRPSVLLITFTQPNVTSNMAIVPTDNGSIDAYASDLTQLILDISSCFAPQQWWRVPLAGAGQRLTHSLSTASATQSHSARRLLTSAEKWPAGIQRSVLPGQCWWRRSVSLRGT